MDRSGQEKIAHAYALILAGGMGTRLWPKSRHHRPKQFLQIQGEVSLLAQTVERLMHTYPLKRIFIICKPFHRREILSQITGIPEENILLEPVPKGTGAAIIWGTLAIACRDPDAVLGVFPSDHIIRPAGRFCNMIERGMMWAADHPALVIYGIKPTRPDTNFGYIEGGSTIDECMSQKCLEVIGFHEKPDPQTAASYLRSHRFLWNSGIFTFSATTLEQILSTGLFPAWYPLVEAALEDRLMDDAIYQNLPDDPFDTAVVEKLVRYHSVRSLLGRFSLVVFPADLEWHDMGVWESYYHATAKDQDGNVRSGPVFCLGCKESLVMSEGSDTLLAAIGLNRMVAVCEGDAVLICPRDELHRIRELIKRLKEEGFGSYL